MLVAQVVEFFLQDRERKGCAPGTVQTYRHQLRLFRRWCEAQGLEQIEKIRERHLEDYLAEMRVRPNLRWRGRVSPVTVQKRAIGLRTFFLFARQRRYVKQDPAAKLFISRRGVRKPKALTPAQVVQLLDVSRWERNASVERDYALIVFLLDSGLRLAEVAALNVTDVELDRGIVHVRHGKGDKERAAVILNETAELVRGYLGPRVPGVDPEAAPVFVDESGKRLSTRRIYRAVKRRAAQTLLYNAVSPHKLRHTWLTEYLNSGGKIHTAAMLAGHDNIATTLGYAASALVPVQREHRKFSAVRNLQSQAASRSLAAPAD